WATDRLLSRRCLLGWGVAAAVGAVFVALCLLYRVREVPAADPPFDVAAFAAGFPTRDQNQVRSRLILAEERFRNHFGKHPELTSTSLNPDRHALLTVPRLGGKLELHVLVHGWPKDSTEERRLATISVRVDVAPGHGEGGERLPGEKVE